MYCNWIDTTGVLRPRAAAPSSVHSIRKCTSPRGLAKEPPKTCWASGLFRLNERVVFLKEGLFLSLYYLLGRVPFVILCSSPQNHPYFLLQYLLIQQSGCTCQQCSHLNWIDTTGMLQPKAAVPCSVQWAGCWHVLVWLWRPRKLQKKKQLARETREIPPNKQQTHINLCNTLNKSTKSCQHLELFEVFPDPSECCWLIFQDFETPEGTRKKGKQSIWKQTIECTPTNNNVNIQNKINLLQRACTHQFDYP